MNYLSLSFSAFVLIVLISFYIIPRKYRGIILLLASIFFYCCFDIRYIVFFMFVAITTYMGAILIEKKTDKKKIFLSCIAVNVALWFSVKAFSWWIYSFNSILDLCGFNIEIPIPVIFVLVPVGISYYLIQAIGYVVDVYKGKIKAEKTFWKYMLFLLYFPAVVQGPISRYDKLLPELLHTRNFDIEKFLYNATLIIFGLIKKMVIADRIGILADYCFDNHNILAGGILYLGAVAYAIQLYTDFAGCVDICRGVSGLFGIELIRNFNSPYFSKSIKEFWGRWHMSLSSWLKDYVYIPLGGNRKGKVRKEINIILVFLVSGLWHGAGFNYIIWGFLQAAYQIVGENTLALRQKFKKWLCICQDSWSDKFYQTVITFNLTVFSWIFFRSDGCRAAIQYIVNMFGRPTVWTAFDGTVFKSGLKGQDLFILAVHICLLIWLDHMEYKKHDVIRNIRNLHIIIRWGIYFVFVFDLLLFGVYGSGYDISGFLYGGF